MKKPNHEKCEICKSKPATRICSEGQDLILCCQKCYDKLALNERLAKDILALHKPDKGGETLEKMFRDCGRPITFTTLDAVAEDGKCKSTTEQIKRR